jgi:phosphate transport system substrate-binding protein
MDKTGPAAARALNTLAAAALVALSGLAGATSAAAAEQNMLWLRGAGATFPAPLYQAWIDAYHAQHPDVDITYDAVGSGAGINRFITHSVDFGASDAPMTDEQMGRVDDGVVLVPATAGMIVVAYSLPGLNGELKLPRDVYPAIFAGEITQWNDPRIQEANPDITLPKRTIAVVTRMDSSGTTYAFTSHLNAISPVWQEKKLGGAKLIDWPGGAMQVKGNEGVATRIKVSEGAIGYVEYGFAKRLGLPVAALQNKAGNYVMPSEAAGIEALAEATETMDAELRGTVDDPSADRAYPLVTYSWMMLYARYADARKAAAVRDFVGWGLTEGQRVSGAELAGYIPLPDGIVAKGQHALATIR